MKLLVKKSAHVCPLEEHITMEWSRDFIEDNIIGGVITLAHAGNNGFLKLVIDNHVTLQFGHLRECCERIDLRADLAPIDQLIGKRVSSIDGTIRYHYMNGYTVARGSSIIGGNHYWRALSIGLKDGSRMNIPWSCNIGMCGSSKIQMFVDVSHARETLGRYKKGQLLKTWLDHEIIRHEPYTWSSDVEICIPVLFGIPNF